MSSLNVSISKNEFDYYYKTKKELAYLEKYLSLLYSSNGKRHSFQSNHSSPQNLNMINKNSFECK